MYVFAGGWGIGHGVYVFEGGGGRGARRDCCIAKQIEYPVSTGNFVPIYWMGDHAVCAW